MMRSAQRAEDGIDSLEFNSQYALTSENALDAFTADEPRTWNTTAIRAMLSSTNSISPFDSAGDCGDPMLDEDLPDLLVGDSMDSFLRHDASPAGFPGP
jgi:hypothetical protein